ncbi:uncharacterized protein LOC126907047 [Daktulosphaira vitifoliae]|uniref:uncharacterized protein LOC126907047 n=1 Tax=Daktulosphaira vitifoliae TaxID=58002 RepID=UPI0021A9B40D|nr:uncharacterized protein LOC126907047 [Daktulosphaira vitifoliae]
MKGAMDSLDLLHNFPWVTCLKNIYMISPLLGSIENIHNILNEKPLSRDDISTYIWTLNTVDDFFQNMIKFVNYETRCYCEFVPYDTNYLWNEWSQEHKAIMDQGITLVFITVLKKKMKDYIKTVIIEKYFQLGFKFDPITEETFVASLDDPIELELELAIDEELPTVLKIENN